MGVRTKKLSRNLLLFFEENEYTDNISSNLVRLFMNRLTIEEENRYEIIGTFNLSKVSKWIKSPDRQRDSNYNKSYHVDFAWQKKSDEMFKSNWEKDKQIIEKALNETKVFTKLHVETHIIIGTSLYTDHFRESLEKLIPRWNSRIQNMYRGLRNTEPTYEKMNKSVSLNQLTLLNGWKTTFATKDEVRQAYVESKWNEEDKTLNVRGTSVNDDLEKMTSQFFKPQKNLNLKDFHRNYMHKTFLFEMLSDDEIEKQQSNEFQFLLSKCERLTVALY